MDEIGTARASSLRIWLKRLGLSLGVVVLLLVVFHRPILQTVGRRVAIQLAAKQNLKVDFRLEGSILGGVILRNVHAVATGPSALESADVDFVRVDYSLWGLLRHGLSDFLKNIEVRNASVALDPAKAPPVPPPEQNQRFTVPAFFPDRLVLVDINVRMAAQPNDLIVQHLNLALLPDAPGELQIAKLQISSGRAWSNVTAQTTYAHRDLFLRNLVLDEQTQLAEVNIDASKIGQNKLAVAVKGTVAGGKVDTTFSLGARDGSPQIDINLDVEDTSVDAVRKYLQPAEAAQKRDATSAVAGAAAAAGGAEPTKAESAGIIPPGIEGRVKKLSVKIGGKADQPNSWNGSIAAEIDDLGAGGATFDHATIDVQAAAGRAQINNVELTRGANKITLQGTTELPDSFAGFGHKATNIQLRGQIPSLAEITAGLPQPITGSAEVNGQVKVQNDTVVADVALAGGPIDFGQGTAQHFVAKLNASKVMPPANEQRPYYDRLTSDVSFEVSDVRAKEYAIDSLVGQVQSADAQLHVQQLLVRRAQNQVALSGTYQLPQDFAKAASQPAAIDFSLDVPQVGAFWAGDALVTGNVQGSGRVNYQQQVGDGYFNIYASNLQARQLTVHELSVQGTTANNVVYLNDLTARFNAHDIIDAHGQVAVQAPYPYSGALAVNVANLSAFEPVLKAALGKETPLAGALAVNWHGRGVGARFDDDGGLSLKLENGRYGGLTNLKANIDASYTPEALDVPLVFFSSDKLLFQADARTRDDHLEISNIQIVQDKAKYANGYASVPFEWKNLGSDRPLIPADGKLLVTFQTENLDLQKLAKDLGTTAPVAGLANVKFDANGTIDDLHAGFDLQLTGLRSEQLKEFTPATFGVTARIENKQLVIDGKLAQARIEPVQISAKMPLDVAKIIQNKKFDEQTPVQGSVRMPRSSINFARQFAPIIERIDGNLALDVNVGGTVAKPSLSGSAESTINAIRFTNPTIPSVTNFNARLAFSGDRLELQQFKGELAGGPFTLSGQVTFPKLTEPTLNLQLNANSVLVARNDNLTVRTDANIRIAGPLNSASVTGSVALTNSQFLKNLDLIPIGVPGRPPPAPAPPSAGTPELSFPNPPLRDWKFDVAITTKDPFRLRGNLANGGALVDMRLTGTGLKPLLNGSVRLQNVEATLPFSRLEITQGFIYFNPEDPLNPGLDLQGTSLIRDYTVRVYVYGTANSPEAVFTSEPPLPQEEIISLLATGTTREELASGANVLAGRALMLVGQQLYQKVFKKGQSSGNTNSVFDRLQVDIGGTDPRTGQQTATARYRATDKVQLIGEIGVQGDFRGTVKYLVRFR